jgi:hypothetical protein
MTDKTPLQAYLRPKPEGLRSRREPLRSGEALRGAITLETGRAPRMPARARQATPMLSGEGVCS